MSSKANFYFPRPTRIIKILVLLVASCAVLPLHGQNSSPDWSQRLAAELPLLGHRNWIVVVDSAYPLQISPGIETLYTGASQTEVLRTVLKDLEKSRHVRPIIYTDAELKSVPEKDAPGIEAYRRDLAALLGNRPVESELHEQIIAQLDEAGKTFHILVLKTNMTLPYTSVFFQLQCGYWTKEAEDNLRASLPKQ